MCMDVGWLLGMTLVSDQNILTSSRLGLGLGFDVLRLASFWLEYRFDFESGTF